MKIINNKYFRIVSAVTLAALLAFSCSGNKNKKAEGAISLEEAEVKPVRPHWENTEKKICIVFGYGYNSEDFVKKEVAHLEDFFGLSDGTENSGLIIPYVYPDDFLVGNIGRISSLVKLLSDVKLAGVITLGAPEYTCNALAQLKETMDIDDPAKKDEEKKEEDKANKVKPYPIYTLFPQDDILAIEATSDFVLDKAVEQTDNVEELQEDVEQVRITGIEDIIDNAIDYMLLTELPLKSDSNLYGHVNHIVGNNHTIKRYVDPETGLSSINHFIIEDVK